MMELKIIEEIRGFVENECKKPTSKYGSEPYNSHFVPMHKYSKILAEKLNADLEIVELAAWLHDIGSIIYGRENHHITSCEIAEKKLKEFNYPEEKIEKIKHCIIAHRGSKDIKRETIEAQIIADADALANFNNIIGPFQAAFVYENLNQEEAKKSISQKFKNLYNKLSPDAKEIARDKFDSIMFLLGDENKDNKIQKNSSHDSNKAHYIAATGIIIKDGKYLIAKRADWEKTFPGKWTVPGGKLEVRDYIDKEKDTAHHWYNILEILLKREVKEETGLIIKNIKYLTSMTFIRPDNIPVLIVSLYADYDSRDVKLSKDLTDYAWVGLEEAKNYDLIEGIYKELEMLDNLLKGIQQEEWRNPKMKIGIDLDEVIVDFITKFLEFYNEKSKKNILKQDIAHYNLWENDFFEFDKEEAIKTIDEFYNSELFDKMELINGAMEIIKELSKNFEIFIITSRPLGIKEKTENFLKNNLSISYETVYSNELHNANGNKNKADICKELGVSILIDDNKDYAKNCAENDIKVFLLSRPWNQNCLSHENIIRVQDWNEILNEINKLSTII